MEEALLLPEVPMVGLVAGGILILAMAVAFLVCIPYWATHPRMPAHEEAEERPLKKAA
jgi:hypothetical protein